MAIVVVLSPVAQRSERNLVKFAKHPPLSFVVFRSWFCHNHLRVGYFYTLLTKTGFFFHYGDSSNVRVDGHIPFGVLFIFSYVS